MNLACRAWGVLVLAVFGCTCRAPPGENGALDARLDRVPRSHGFERRAALRDTSIRVASSTPEQETRDGGDHAWYTRHAAFGIDDFLEREARG
jgi:hypothetical protein